MKPDIFVHMKSSGIFACFLALVCVSAKAQVSEIKAGDTITGTVCMPKRVYPDDLWTFVKGRYSDVERQPIIPQDYICGYVVHPIKFADQLPWYGLFLKKDAIGYMVVFRYGGGSYNDTLRIDNALAERLSGSVRLTIDKADAVAAKLEEYKREDDSIRVAQGNDGGTEAVGFRLTEGSIVYSLIPGRAAYRWTEEIPDIVWNGLYHQFGKEMGYKPVPWTWTGSGGTGDTRDDGYAVISWVNGLRYRYDIETGQATVEYNDNRTPDGDLTILSSVTTFSKTFPVTAIDNGAFDESVYKKATLYVPKGWKQKQASKKGAAWGKFENIEYY